MSEPTDIDTEQTETETEGAESEASNVVQLRPRHAFADEPLPHDDSPDDDDDEWIVPGEEGAPLAHQLEALLFVSPVPLTVEALAEATGVDHDELHDCLLDMMQQYSETTSGIVLERVSGGWAFRASDRTRDALSRLLRPQADTKLSPSALETLAIVAYLQPVSRPDVAKIRGVSVDAAMSSLLERGLVEESGRSETGAVLFRTTALFERAFGLSSINALPELEGFGPSEEDVQRLREQLDTMASARVE